jgi:hypothetical protein
MRRDRVAVYWDGPPGRRFSFCLWSVDVSEEELNTLRPAGRVPVGR